jgi:hypothetical protein
LTLATGQGEGATGVTDLVGLRFLRRTHSTTMAANSPIALHAAKTSPTVKEAGQYRITSRCRPGGTRAWSITPE